MVICDKCGRMKAFVFVFALVAAVIGSAEGLQAVFANVEAVAQATPRQAQLDRKPPPRKARKARVAVTGKGLVAKPLFKVGILSDTHVRTTVESCARLRAALEVFKRADADLVCNLGDVAERHYPEAYRLYRETFGLERVSLKRYRGTIQSRRFGDG